MQMVQVRGSVAELQQLMTASLLLANSNSLELSGPNKTQPDSIQLLYNLAKREEINTSSIHADIVADLSIPIDCVVYEPARNQPRMVAKYTPGGREKRFVWVEWKTYHRELSRNVSGQLELDISRQHYSNRHNWRIFWHLPNRRISVPPIVRATCSRKIIRKERVGWAGSFRCRIAQMMLPLHGLYTGYSLVSPNLLYPTG